MFHQKDYNFFLLRVFLDFFAIIFSWMIAYFVRFKLIPGGQLNLELFFFNLGFIISPLVIISLNNVKLYNSTRILSWVEELQAIIKGVARASLLIIVLFYFFSPEKVSRLTLLIFWVVLTFLLVFERAMVNQLIGKARAKGRNVKTVLIVGHGDRVDEFIKKILGSKRVGLQCLGICDGDLNKDYGLENYKQPLPELIADMNPDIIAVGYPPQESEKIWFQVNSCNNSFSNLLVIQDINSSQLGTTLLDFYNIPVLNINQTQIGFFGRLIKRLFEFSVSLIGLVVISPLLIFIALGIKLTSRGPVFYSQKRVTENGNIFSMLKFRSMYQGKKSHAVQMTVKNDPRVTRFGKFLRKTSLDELPQLFNVLKGDMALVGPRPERPELVEKFSAEISGYQLRHKVKAGISGWAQVNGWRGDTSIETRIEFDLYYIRNWSLFFDIKIILFTFFKGFVNKNAY
ncbi:MAG: undecaprenyl-phosphate glucose phosphotransferase [Bacteroidetes bacterium]|nr:undecaprenyl-phosphate glucose phosphotransferase [Bacteroidota bacterium]